MFKINAISSLVSNLERCFTGYAKYCISKNNYIHGCTRPFKLSTIPCYNFSTISEERLNEIFDKQLTEAFEGEDLWPSLTPYREAHQTFIIHPYIKWGPKKKQSTTPLIQLEEAIALIKSLPDWRVKAAKTVALMGFEKKSLFNKGQLSELQTEVKNNVDISCVFINTKSLSSSQHKFLEKAFGIPVLDRYSIIINIFRLHAKTKEAKLQVAMAEIPYLRSRIRWETEPNDHLNTGYFDQERRLKSLAEKEQKIKISITTLRKKRELLRNKRKIMEFPIIAVVGYTNAGKTSLIKCLTKDQSIKPKDRLFATLDVTLHSGYLLNNLEVLYVDTIGFISDISTTLIEPFVATLEDALQADLIIHVQDLSHPDYKYQNEQVLSTLKSFNLSNSLLENMITVGNKIDKVEETLSSMDPNQILVSCEYNIGIKELKQCIEEKVLKSTGLMKVNARIKNGGSEYSWLYKNSTVLNVEVDSQNSNYVLITVLISKTKFGQFRRHFIE